MEKDYYFYLAFENSICKDYVTEKFFNALNHDVIPIVLGGANYSSIAPYKSYIDAYKDFKNDPGKLARHLQTLMEDKRLYAEHFWWKNYYSVNTDSLAKYHCEICEKLNQINTVSIYEDLEEWWEHRARCKKIHVRKRDK